SEIQVDQDRTSPPPHSLATTSATRPAVDRGSRPSELPSRSNTPRACTKSAANPASGSASSSASAYSRAVSSIRQIIPRPRAGYVRRMAELHEMTAWDQAEAVRSRRVSPVELVEHYLDRIERRNAE